MIITTSGRRVRRIGIAAAATASAAVGISLVAPMAAHADAKDACSGVKAPCTIVAQVDVTGDGKPDSVGIVTQKSSYGQTTRYQVRVRTADGKLLRKTDKHASWEGKLFYGAAAIDGTPGKDLVVGHVAGAHTAFYHVLSYHDGKFVLRKAPKLPAAVGKDINTNVRSWVVDSAASSFAGIRRTVSQHQVSLSEDFGSRDPNAPQYTGWHLVYRWSGDHWAPVSHHQKKWTDKQASTKWGWHVKGLKRGLF